MRLYIQSFILLLFLTPVLQAQNASEPILTPQDTVFVQLDEHNKIIYEHCVKPGQTIYGISRLFRCQSKDVLYINKMHPDSALQIGQSLKIPLQAGLIDISIHPPSTASMPVVYEVKKSETLYRLSQVYFHQSIEQMIARNELHDFTIQTKQKMVIGWMTIQKIKVVDPIELDTTIIATPETVADLAATAPIELLSAGVNTTVVYQDLVFDEIVLASRTDTLGLALGDNLDEDLEEDEESTLTAVNSRGIATWEKNGTDKVNKFVMHRTAEINSLIEIRNPLTNNKCFARVVGHIPSKVHSDDVKLIMTPAVANELGILDKRALVEMRFYINSVASVN